MTRQRLTAVGLVVAAVLLVAGWAFAIKHVGRSGGNDSVASASTSVFAPTPSAEPSAVRPSTVYVLGDDLVAPAVRGPGRSAADVALFRLGVPGTVSGQAGSGFLPGLDRKAQTYSYRLASDVAGRPVKLLVIVAGSGDRNAGAMSLRAAVDLTLNAARQAAPGAMLLLVGPLGSPNAGVEAAMEAERAVLRSVAQDAGGVMFVDPIERGWVRDAPSDSFRPDGLNVARGGDPYLGQRLADALKPLVDQVAR